MEQPASNQTSGQPAERTYELRSERTRHVVGRVPPRLLRWGTLITTLSLLLLLALAYALPYQRIYTGRAVLTDSLRLSAEATAESELLLHFDGDQRPEVVGQVIEFESPEGRTSAQLLELSSLRDTLGRQRACCRFAPDSLVLSPQMMDFRIVSTEGRLLNRLFHIGQ